MVTTFKNFDCFTGLFVLFFTQDEENAKAYAGTSGASLFPKSWDCDHLLTKFKISSSAARTSASSRSRCLIKF